MEVQEVIFSVFPFKFHLLWNNSGELIRLKFEFSFVFKKKTVVYIKNEKITILPEERIKLIQIYNYDPD